jgi:hypothetical protein
VILQNTSLAPRCRKGAIHPIIRSPRRRSRAASPARRCPDEKALIEALARKDYAEYDRVRADLAETLGMRVGTLDGKVEALRKKMEAEDDCCLCTKRRRRPKPPHRRLNRLLREPFS